MMFVRKLKCVYTGLHDWKQLQGYNLLLELLNYL